MPTEILPREKIEISVILYPENGYWIAQGLQHDITARGETAADASERFNSKIGAEFVISLEVGDPTPLSAVEPAPQKFWTMYEKAKERGNEEGSLPLADGETASFVKHERIFDQAA